MRSKSCATSVWRPLVPIYLPDTTICNDCGKRLGLGPMANIVCFGELLLRIGSPDSEPLLHSSALQGFVGGA